MGLKVKVDKRLVEEEINKELAEFGLAFDFPTDEEISKSVDSKKKKDKKEDKKETKKK